MVKILPLVTLCSKCNVRLEYNIKDVFDEDHPYSIDGIDIKHNICHYIICPNCGDKVYLD